MRDYVVLGPTPADEDCTAAGVCPNRERYESTVYAQQLARMFPPPQGCRFIAKAFPHDFGSYYEVVVTYDDTSEEQTDFAFKVESMAPARWDSEARRQLALYNPA